MKKITKFLAVLIVLFSVVSCSILKQKGTLTDIKIVLDNTQNINYGSKVLFKIVANYSSGKSKNIIGKKETKVKVYGGEYKKGRIRLPKYPTEFKEDYFYVSASYILNNKIYKDSIASHIIIK